MCVPSALLAYDDGEAQHRGAHGSPAYPGLIPTDHRHNYDYVRVDDLSLGERAIGWARAELRSVASRPALVLAGFAVAGSLAAIAASITDSFAFGAGFREHLLVAVQGFGLICQLLLVVAALLVIVDGLAGGPESHRSISFYGLAVLGGLGVIANFAEMISLLSEAGIPPVGVGTLTEAYTLVVFSSLAPALLALVPLYVGLSGPRTVREGSVVADVE